MDRFYPGPGDAPSWLHDFFLFLIVLALVAGVILVVVLVSRQPFRIRGGWGGYPQQRWKHNAAVAELDLRYARGEIDRTEYLQRRADLLSGPLSRPGEPSPPAV